MPHREVIDGVLVIFGGAFLITPGFITDIVGLTLLVPPSRAVDEALPRPAARPARDGRRRPARTTTWRAPRATTTTCPAAGSSGERSGARAVLLRRSPTTYTGRRGRARRSCSRAASRWRSRRAPRSSPPATAGAPSSPEPCPRVRAGLRAAPTSAACAPAWSASAARPPGARWTASARSPRRRSRRAGRSSTPSGASPRWSTSSTPCSRSRAARAARSGHGHEQVRARLVEDERCSTWRTARISTVYDGGWPPAQRRARAVAARARTSPAAAPAS